VVSVVKNLRTGKEKKFKMPKFCPICGGEVGKLQITNSKLQTRAKILNLKKEENTKSNLGVALYCLNPNCFAVETQKIIHFVSRKGFDIEGLGDKIVEQLIQAGIIENIADIFAITKGDLEPLERFAQKSADNLVKAIAEKKKISLDKLLFSLGIRFVGEETAFLIANAIRKEFPIFNFKFPNGGANGLVDIIRIFPIITIEEWMNIDGIGEKSAQSLVNWFGDKKNIEILKKMQELGVSIIADGFKGEYGKIIGKTFVLTGSLTGFTREEIKDIIRKEGGKISSLISAKTDFLIAGENVGSKYEKAKKLGVNIISEEKFKKMIGKNNL
jgi:DNA ligase (NAD+)